MHVFLCYVIPDHCGHEVIKTITSTEESAKKWQENTILELGENEIVRYKEVEVNH